MENLGSLDVQRKPWQPMADDVKQCLTVLSTPDKASFCVHPLCCNSSDMSQ